MNINRVNLRHFSGRTHDLPLNFDEKTLKGGIRIILERIKGYALVQNKFVKIKEYEQFRRGEAFNRGNRKFSSVLEEFTQWIAPEVKRESENTSTENKVVRSFRKAFDYHKSTEKNIKKNNLFKLDISVEDLKENIKLFFANLNVLKYDEESGILSTLRGIEKQKILNKLKFKTYEVKNILNNFKQCREKGINAVTISNNEKCEIHSNKLTITIKDLIELFIIKIPNFMKIVNKSSELSRLFNNVLISSIADTYNVNGIKDLFESIAKNEGIKEFGDVEGERGTINFEILKELFKKIDFNGYNEVVNTLMQNEENTTDSISLKIAEKQKGIPYLNECLRTYLLKYVESINKETKQKFKSAWPVGDQAINQIVNWTEIKNLIENSDKT